MLSSRCVNSGLAVRRTTSGVIGRVTDSSRCLRAAALPAVKTNSLVICLDSEEGRLTRGRRASLLLSAAQDCTPRQNSRFSGDCYGNAGPGVTELGESP